MSIRTSFQHGIASVHPIRGDEIRALRKLRRDYLKDAYVFVSERGGPIGPIGFHRLIQRVGEAAKMPFPIHPHMLRHACGDPVRYGLVASLPRPGRNATGAALLTTDLAEKRLELLKQMVSGVTRVARRA